MTVHLYCKNSCSKLVLTAKLAVLTLLLSSDLGFPLDESTANGRATAHQLYCSAIEVGFGANDPSHNQCRQRANDMSYDGEWQDSDFFPVIIADKER